MAADGGEQPAGSAAAGVGPGERREGWVVGELELTRRRVTQRGARAAGQVGGHAAAVGAEGGVADGVDAAVDDVEPSGMNAAVDRARSETERAQLPAGDDAVLATGEPSPPTPASVGRATSSRR